MSTPEAIFLVGVPTSGKSTYANKLKKLPYWENAIVLSTDNYIERVAQERGLTYNEVFKGNIRFAQISMMKSLCKAIEENKSLIWDQTNIIRKQRREKLKKIPTHYKKTVVYFVVNLETALKRNTQRPGKVIPPEVLERMIKEYELPTLEEGFGFIERG
jgi:tRNA uridine 5-carbamoylmethylation protein Kti12